MEVEEDGETESKREGKVVDDAIPSESCGIKITTDTLQWTFTPCNRR